MEVQAKDRIWYRDGQELGGGAWVKKEWSVGRANGVTRGNGSFGVGNQAAGMAEPGGEQDAVSMAAPLDPEVGGQGLAAGHPEAVPPHEKVDVPKPEEEGDFPKPEGEEDVPRPEEEEDVEADSEALADGADGAGGAKKKKDKDKKKKDKEKDKEKEKDKDKKADETTALLPDLEAQPLVKKKKKNKDDDIKTHMANERTFFKWLFFGFHLGAMGTFILTFFGQSTPGRTWMVFIIWILSFFFIYYGLFRYFMRRRALRQGLRSPDDWDDPYGPVMMSGALFLIVIMIIIFAIVTDSVPKKGGWKGH